MCVVIGCKGPESKERTKILRLTAEGLVGSALVLELVTFGWLRRIRDYPPLFYRAASRGCHQSRDAPVRQGRVQMDKIWEGGLVQVFVGQDRL